LPDLIDTQDAFDSAMHALRDERALAVDTESDSFHAYRAQVCLLQLSAPGRDLLIDPLAGLNMDALGALLGDPSREVVLHAAENDVIAMHHEFGWRLPGLFDTQVASFVLGLAPYSLAGIVEARFGVKLDKSEQRSDWSKRPLTEKQLRYASEDTHYLLELAEDLRRRAKEAGREDEIDWECRRIAEREWEPEPFDPDGFRRMSGARDLGDVELRILRDLYLMRNGDSERRNVAPFRIAGDSLLVDIARRRAKSGSKPRGFWGRYGKRVCGIVEQAPGRGPLPRKKRRHQRGTPTSPEVKQVYERLRRWRSRAAEDRGVEPFVVARNQLLSRIAAAQCTTKEDLAQLIQPFRLNEYGDAILAVVCNNSQNGE
jgi:ribonuclease D